MRIAGGVSPSVVSLRARVTGGAVRGRLTPIVSGAEAADGPFLYVHSPGGLSVNGMAWLRVPVDAVSATSPAMRSLHGLTPAPLLRLLGAAETTALAVPSGVIRGTVPYDDPVVVDALQALTDRVQFRHLEVTAVVGEDGLVHRLRLTGVTADGSSRLRIDSRLSAFGKAVRAPSPSQGSFFDQQESRLAA
jgi:hypothetical protein